MKQSHMPLKLRKISFEYHEAVLGTTSVALVLCPTGMCALFNKRRYDRSAEVRPHFFERFHIFVDRRRDRNVERRRDHGVCSEKASSWRKRACRRAPYVENRTKERTHHSETEEEATKRRRFG
jgi:ABC-type nickel/cobalt efflux system permease component RcnA